MILYHGTRGYYQSWACTWHNCCIFLHMCYHVGRQANRHLSKHLVSMVIYHIGGQRELYDCSQMLSEKYCSLSCPSKTIWYDAMKNGCSVVYRKQYHVGILQACFKIWSMNAIALIREHQYGSSIDSHQLCLPAWHYAMIQIPYSLWQLMHAPLRPSYLYLAGSLLASLLPWALSVCYLPHSYCTPAGCCSKL